jgi:heme oxygenase
MSPDVEEGEYVNYLAAMCEVIAWTERVIFPRVAAVVPDIERRRKLSAIQHDLAGYTSSVSTQAFTPAIATGTGFALGFMYVMEGSTLGGMVILKHIKERGFAREDNTNFFTGYGPATGSSWRSFIDLFSRYVVQHHLEDEAIEGAKAAFQSIGQYFEAHPVLS